MKTNNIIYLSEAIIMAIIIISGFIIYEGKHKKGFIKFLGIGLAIFITVFVATLILEKPEMETKQIINIEVNSAQRIEKPYTTYHLKNVTDMVIIDGNINYEKIGEYKIQYKLVTWKGTYSQEAVVRIVDTKAPEIILEGEENLKLSYSKEYKEPGFKAIDEYEGNITDKVKTTKQDIDETNFNIKYEVKDSSQNTTEKIRKVSIVDDVPPIITLNGNSSMTVYLNSKYEEKGAKANDEKDGDLTDKIVTEGQVDTSKEGTYTITYKVADKSGNEATQKRTVIVKKQVAVVQATTSTQTQSGNSSGQKGVIYLTFDDGPSTNITPKVLDILKAKNVKATFFILNYNSECEKLVKREYAEGHTRIFTCIF